jgi:hypothetical protein
MKNLFLGGLDGIFPLFVRRKRVFEPLPFQRGGLWITKKNFGRFLKTREIRACTDFTERFAMNPNPKE